jgi:hypothetical protein
MGCTRINLPNAAKPNERRPRPGPPALLDDLVDDGPLIDSGLAVDEVLVTTERDNDGRKRRYLHTSFVMESRLADGNSGPILTPQPHLKGDGILIRYWGFQIHL